MLSQIIVAGILSEVSYRLAGANSNFPILSVKISTGEKFYTLESTGDQARVYNAVVGEMPIGTPVKATANLAGRKNPTYGVFISLNLTGITLDFSGKQGASGVLSGIVGDVEEVPNKAGTSTVKRAQLQLVLGDRDGLILDGKQEIRFDQASREGRTAEWANHKGQYAEVEVALDVYVTEKGRSIPNYTARTVSFSELPSYWADLVAGNEINAAV